MSSSQTRAPAKSPVLEFESLRHRFHSFCGKVLPTVLEDGLRDAVSHSKFNHWLLIREQGPCEKALFTSNMSFANVLKAPPPDLTLAEANEYGRECSSYLRHKISVIFPSRGSSKDPAIQRLSELPRADINATPTPAFGALRDKIQALLLEDPFNRPAYEHYLREYHKLWQSLRSGRDDSKINLNEYHDKLRRIDSLRLEIYAAHAAIHEILETKTQNGHMSMLRYRACVQLLNKLFQLFYVTIFYPEFLTDLLHVEKYTVMRDSLQEICHDHIRGFKREQPPKVDEQEVVSAFLTRVVNRFFVPHTWSWAGQDHPIARHLESTASETLREQRKAQMTSLLGIQDEAQKAHVRLMARVTEHGDAVKGNRPRTELENAQDAIHTAKQSLDAWHGAFDDCLEKNVNPAFHVHKAFRAVQDQLRTHRAAQFHEEHAYAPVLAGAPVNYDDYGNLTVRTAQNELRHHTFWTKSRHIRRYMNHLTSYEFQAVQKLVNEAASYKIQQATAQSDYRGILTRLMSLLQQAEDNHEQLAEHVGRPSMVPAILPPQELGTEEEHKVFEYYRGDLHRRRDFRRYQIRKLRDDFYEAEAAARAAARRR